MSEDKQDNIDSEPKNDSQKKPSPETSTVQAFGAWLKSQREAKGISLEDISHNTKIQVSQLKELEEGWKGKAPATAFIRGFLVNYARQLSLDENEVLIRYKEEFVSSGARADSTPMPPSNKGTDTGPAVKIIQTPAMGLSPRAKLEDKKESFKISSKLLLTLLVLVIFIGLVGFLFNVGKKNIEENSDATPSIEENEVSVAPAPDNTTLIENLEIVDESESEEGEVTEESPSAEEQNVASAPVETAKKKVPVVEKKPKEKKKAVVVRKGEVKIRATDSSWVNIRIDNNTSTAGFQMKKGQTKIYKVKSKVELSISDASALQIEWEGQRYGKIGSKGELKTIVIPDELSKLKKL